MRHHSHGPAVTPGVKEEGRSGPLEETAGRTEEEETQGAILTRSPRSYGCVYLSICYVENVMYLKSTEPANPTL